MLFWKLQNYERIPLRVLISVTTYLEICKTNSLLSNIDDNY